MDPAGITFTFSRAMPKNLLEISQIVSNLWGKVGKKTLLSQIPFVSDPDEELEIVKKEAEEALEQQTKAFGSFSNTKPDSKKPEESPPGQKDDVDE